MLLLPFLNTLFRNCNDKQFNILILIIFFFNSIQPMFFHNAIGENGYGITHAILMVSLGHWIKRNNFCFSKIKSFLVAILAFTVCAGINLGWLIVTGDRNRIIADYNSPFIVLASCMVFLFFLSMESKGKGIFTKLSPYIFAVYLVNDNPHMRAVVYEQILHCADFYHSPWFIVHYVVSCLLFFVVGMALDFLYEFIIRRLAKLIKEKTSSKGESQ